MLFFFPVNLSNVGVASSSSGSVGTIIPHHGLLSLLIGEHRGAFTPLVSVTVTQGGQPCFCCGSDSLNNVLSMLQPFVASQVKRFNHNFDLNLTNHSALIASQLYQPIILHNNNANNWCDNIYLNKQYSSLYDVGDKWATKKDEKWSLKIVSPSLPIYISNCILFSFLGKISCWNCTPT